MSPISTARKKVSHGSVREAFKNEAGAIDLASIMVGIIVIGLIGGVIAATVFAVIPWAQDNAAKQQLDSVASAQAAYIGLSADGGVPATFGGADITPVATGTSPVTYTATNLATNGRLAVGGSGPVTQTLFNAPSGTKLVIAEYGSGVDAHYVAVMKSASGNRFYISDTKTQPTPVAAGGLGTQTTTSGATPSQISTAQLNSVVNAIVTALG